jgi:TRAP-type uncharacterized transport system substrate-binding protein
MPDDVAYNIVKTLMEKKPELVAVHREAENFEIKGQSNDNTPIPFHPGAAKYFKEKGAKL